MILKDRFLIQSAPDIYRKLEKQVFRLNQSLKKKCCNWLRRYITVENMRGKMRGERTKSGIQKMEASTMAIRSALKQPEEKCAEKPMWKEMDLLLPWKGGASQAGLPSGI